MTDMKSLFTGRNVLITGVCGTIGTETLRQVAQLTDGRIVGLDNNETEIFMASEQWRDRDNIELFVGDIRDRDKLTSKMRGIDVVLHTAALKHVGVCELSPEDAIQTNITGIQNVIEAAFHNQVGRVVFTSSDKAVNPTNVMGTSKLMGERLFTAANARRRDDDDPVFTTTRFGNVLGSRGSVIPLFQQQILSGGPVTLTDPNMTRFIMSVEEAVSLVLRSVHLSLGGEVFITKMPVVRIEDLARAMILNISATTDLRGEDINIETTGVRPGEKLYEELMNGEEARRTVELDDFLVVLPAFIDIYRKTEYKYDGMRRLDKPEYNSQLELEMSLEQIRHFLHQHNLIPSDHAEIQDSLRCAS